MYLTTQDPQESIFIMFVCEFQSTNILLLKMAENINQKKKTVENKSYHINLREEQKAKQHMDMTMWLKIKI